jgi:predicted ArsR family transcriptional regulator
MIMDAWVLLAPDAGSPLGESRDRVLDLLLTTGGPLDVRDVARRVGLHPNTARFHLDALVDSGLAMRESRRRDTPGRPRLAYWAAPGSTPAGRRRYRLLAEMLASMVAEMVPEPGEAAAAAGREWGHYLTGQPLPFRRISPQEAVEELTAVLANIGFGTETVASGGGYRLLLHQCPFREVAERHREVVCALHLGLMQGVLRQLRAPVTADRLLPFAEPGVCLTELGAGQAQDDTRPVRGLLGQAM